METFPAQRVSDTLRDAAHQTRDVAHHLGATIRDGFRELRAETSSLEARAEAAVHRAIEKAEDETRMVGARLTDWTRLPFGPLSAALVWPTMAASGALLLYEYQTIELNRARFARRSALLKPVELQLQETHADPFERLYHQHQQTGEALITLIPSLYTFSLLVSPRWAFALGGGWLASRIIYLYAHKMGFDPATEKPFYSASYVAQMALLLGSAVTSARLSVGLFLSWLGAVGTTEQVAVTPVVIEEVPVMPGKEPDFVVHESE